MKHIVLLFGDDQFGIREKIARWKSAFVEKYGGDINIDEFDGKTPPNQIIEATQTLPFLGEKRLVIVKGFLEDQSADDQKLMAEQLKDIPESCALLFWENKSPDKRTSLFKKLQKECRLEECKPLSGDLLNGWIIEQITTRGGHIDRNTANHLGTIVGEDTWKLSNEIAKLTTYAAGEPITVDMIDRLVHGQISSNIFKLTDSIGQRRTQEAIRILHNLVEQGEEVPMIFAMLVRQFRMLIQMRELKSLGKSSGDIAAKIKQHPYAVSQSLAQTNNFTKDELEAIYSKLLHIDLRLKTGAFRYLESDKKEFLLEIEKLLVEACA